MRSFIAFFAFAAAASAATSPLAAREDAQTCAMKTLLSSNACNTGDSACLCSDATRKSVMQEIKTACGADQSEATDNLAKEACRTQKVRRESQPAAAASPSSSSAASRTNGAQQSSDDQGCTCANTPSDASPSSNGPATAAQDPSDDEDPLGFTDPEGSNDNNDNNGQGAFGALPSSHGSNTPSSTDNSEAPAQSSRVHAVASVKATPASSSAARHGAMATPSSSIPAIATPSGADPIASFQGAGSQVIPSMSVVVAGLLAGVVGVFAAM